ncbi:hypothetical protein H310_04136 [Aphanomyces invadans]|uniref:EGF-like domain-containing protein n=1 Tax=Aphanomyces invadans TaxID=157072 RepID=A0A024UFY8_9STRA|nr:hypothetical protein H310_04136 [Aphanomyces invadans]ETW05115.1 hypothetical protein H310_04136 [Aphanomyces invadans]|eukprot:XP_008866553.1 hypothetical protein H310_04136 [Aphanomyces invadans]
MTVRDSMGVDLGQPTFPTKSGVGTWVDVDTPAHALRKKSSRGDEWTLVMSDEFNRDGRSFVAGQDHLWTALNIPDGVNDAVGWYNSSNVFTLNGRLVIRVDEGPRNATYFNQWLETPAMETRTMHYTGGMVQSWNKFCIQGGLIEVSVKLPGAVDAKSWNPHVRKRLQATDPITDVRFYPTWPGVWLMGNLGRALFSGSTTRMWPWSYNECDATLAPHQAINACNATPGYGLNPYQGRGAPELDVLEGGGKGISTSLQVAPGMPEPYRTLSPITMAPYYDTWFCYYVKTCRTPGANIPDAPTSAYAHRPYKTWYQNLRYAANHRCPSKSFLMQSVDEVVGARGNITSNTFDKTQMSASEDVHADLGLMDEAGHRWGINSNGSMCFAFLNGYTGTFLCDPDSSNPKCASPRRPGVGPTNQMDPFAYQMDAISANWNINFEAYTRLNQYSLEWVAGPDGYARWMLDDNPLFEVPAASLVNVPQGGPIRNPTKLMVEEPLYLIFNIAVAKSWGAQPPNVNIGPCRGNATHPPKYSAAWNLSNNICNSFPMYMEIDFIRIYQDESRMSVGCDPPSHPTKEWIAGHMDQYTDDKNPDIPVAGRATCRTDADCTTTGMAATGLCRRGRCKCLQNYGGPRCTKFCPGPLRGPTRVHGLILVGSCVAVLTVTCVLRVSRLRLANLDAHHRRVLGLSAAEDDMDSCDEDDENMDDDHQEKSHHF